MSGQVGRGRRGGPRKDPRGRRPGGQPGGERSGERGRGTAHAGTLRPAAEDGVGQPAGPGLLAPHQVDKLLARLGHDGAAAALGAGRARRLPAAEAAAAAAAPAQGRGGAAPGGRREGSGGALARARVGGVSPGAWRSCACVAASFPPARQALLLPRAPEVGKVGGWEEAGWFGGRRTCRPAVARYPLLREENVG